MGVWRDMDRNQDQSKNDSGITSNLDIPTNVGSGRGPLVAAMATSRLPELREHGFSHIGSPGRFITKRTPAVASCATTVTTPSVLTLAIFSQELVPTTTTIGIARAEAVGERLVPRRTSVGLPIPTHVSLTMRCGSLMRVTERG